MLRGVADVAAACRVDQVRELVAGMEIIEPGLTWPPLWRPDPGDELPANPEESYYCVVVARTT